VEAATEQWITALSEHVGTSTLHDVHVLAEALFDLTTAHPSGVAQFFAGRPTRLSNLVRDEASLPAARRRVRTVAARSADEAHDSGFATTSLAVGIATWTEPISSVSAEGVSTSSDDDDLAGVAALALVANRRAEETPQSPVTQRASEDYADATTTELPGVAAPAEPQPTRTLHAPVVMRPVALSICDDGDYELTLEASAEINPVLARALVMRGALTDPHVLAESTFTSTGFDPAGALTRVTQLGKAVLADFTLNRRMLLGTFAQPGQALIDDCDALSSTFEAHPVIAALSGSDDAVSELQSADLPHLNPGDPEPNNERGVGHLDAHQHRVIAAVAAGEHVYVDAPAGADATGTAAGIVAEVAAAGKTVLYVAGQRHGIVDLQARLADLDVDGLVLDLPPVPSWRAEVAKRLVTAMACEPEAINSEGITRLRDALTHTRESLRTYVDTLHCVRAPWNVSAYEALQSLARFSARRPAPCNTARLSQNAVVALNPETRRHIIADLERAAVLGAFTDKVAQSPWHEASLFTSDAAKDALARVKRLSESTLPQLQRQVDYVCEVTSLAAPTTVRQWRDQVRMLSGMRATLDIFHPMVFERDTQELIEATASRKWRAAHKVEMGSVQRGRLRKKVAEMVRPGVRVSDVHAALLTVQAQRTVWVEHHPTGGWPTLPEGLATIEDTLRVVTMDVEALEPVLATTHAGAGLSDLDLASLADRLEALAQDESALERLPERASAMRRVRKAGLGDLVTELEERHVASHRVAGEVELAWWSSAFEQILESEPSLATQDGKTLETLTRRFTDLDRHHVASLAAPVRAAVRQHLSAAMAAHPDVAASLFALLVEGRFTSLRSVMETYGKVAKRLRPVIVATPAMVPQLLPTEQCVDVVVLDHLHHTNLPDVVGAVARGKQIVVIGDDRCASGNATAAFAEVMNRLAILPKPAMRDSFLTAMLERHGYQDLVTSATTPRNTASVFLDVVDGHGMPDAHSGVVESTEAEAQRVVEIAIEHALRSPELTLAVVTVFPVHAERIRELLDAETRANPALVPFFSKDGTGGFIVTDAGSLGGIQRDTVVFSLGLGRTPHGRVLHRFGPISAAGGEGLVLSVIGACARNLHVVSCFGAADLDLDRLRTPGPRALGELLEIAEARHGAVEPLASSGGDDSMAFDTVLMDVGERLWQMGYTVDVSFGTGDGIRIPLVVGHPDISGEHLVAVLTDNAGYANEPSLRKRDRLTAEQLESAGWHVIHVWSTAAFLDPSAEVDRICRLVQVAHDTRLRAAGVITHVAVPILADDV
jgi:hypothetical protein